MAAVNFKLKNTNNEKRKVSVFTANIQPATVMVADGFATAGTVATGDVITLGTIPDNSIIVGAEVFVVTGLTTGTQTARLAVGGTEVMAAVAVGTASNITKGTTTKKKVSGAITLTTGVADMVDGNLQVIISYVETDLGIGEFTAV